MAKSFLIALPVRNGGEHLRECVASILSQSYRDFELVVLDNASTDGSVSWLRAQTDSRISVVETTTPLSMEDSWARILSLPNPHEYMTIIGHDDLFDEHFLETICRLIDDHPQASLYQTHFRLIDVVGKRMRSCLPIPKIEKAHEFLAARLSLRRDSFGTGYVCRSSDYKKCGGIPLYRKLLYADDALWLTLMRPAYKVAHSDECFAYRVHATSASYAPDWQSTYDSLHKYVEFLVRSAAASDETAATLRAKLPFYMRFWFRWAYFSAVKTDEGRQDVAKAVADLIPQVTKLLSEADALAYRHQVQRDLFSALARLRFYLWRVCKGVRVRWWEAPRGRLRVAFADPDHASKGWSSG